MLFWVQATVKNCVIARKSFLTQCSEQRAKSMEMYKDIVTSILVQMLYNVLLAPLAFET